MEDIVRSDSCTHFGHQLYRRVWDSARLRVGLEQRWWENTLQYHGKYDEDTQKKLRETEGASRLFVNMTRPKTRVLRARLIDILFPTDEANWDIEPTPVPRISRAAARQEGAEKYPLQKQETDQAQQQLATAKERAANMRRLMRDQLIDAKYEEVGRRMITQACRLGAGVLKGPYAVTRQRRKWDSTSNGKAWSVKKLDDDRPMYQFVNLWDFYPDMDASTIEDCEFCFQLHRMSTSELRKMGQSGMFDQDTVRFLLSQTTDYRQIDPGHFNENLRWVRQLENDLDETGMNRYNIFEYHGQLEYEEFGMLCEEFKKDELFNQFAKGKDNDRLFSIGGVIWFCADQVLRFGINPLESGELPYSVFRLDPTENSLIGSAGIPQMLQDPQSSLNAAWRIAMEAAGLEGVPMYQIDKTRIEPENGVWEIAPRKIWLAKGGFGSVEGGPPIIPTAINGTLEQILALAKESRRFMDDEANLPLIAQGDQGSGARQTAHGMTLLANAVNVLFRDSARGFDSEVTIPCMKRLYEWNMLLANDDDVKGDMEIKALGSSVLLVNEIVSQNLLMVLNLSASNPEAFEALRGRDLLKLLFRTMRLDRYNLIMTDEEWSQLQAEKAKQPPPTDPAIDAKLQIAQMQIDSQQQIKMMEVELAKIQLAAKYELSGAQVEAAMKKAELQMQGKERLFTAEVAVKEKHGEGV